MVGSQASNFPSVSWSQTIGLRPKSTTSRQKEPDSNLNQYDTSSPRRRRQTWMDIKWFPDLSDSYIFWRGVKQSVFMIIIHLKTICPTFDQLLSFPQFCIFFGTLRDWLLDSFTPPKNNPKEKTHPKSVTEIHPGPLWGARRVYCRTSPLYARQSQQADKSMDCSRAWFPWSLPTKHAMLRNERMMCWTPIHGKRMNGGSNVWIFVGGVDISWSCASKQKSK